MERPTDDIDPMLMVRAAPALLTAFATFGQRGDDPYDVARALAQEAKMAGFTKRGRLRLLDYAYEFVDELLRQGRDPIALGTRAPDPQRLFDIDNLRGLFDSPDTVQQAEFELNLQIEARDRALIEQLIAATRLYATSDDVKQLLEFTIRLRGFAPFNAMLLHIQKPGLTHAATAADWWKRFRRVPKDGARPLLVLRTMGPVDFVFDILDTEGDAVPAHAFSFPTLGALARDRFDTILGTVGKTGIDLVRLDAGDGRAGWIRRLPPPPQTKAKQRYQLAYNTNHPLPTQLVTVAHELSHLYLGHLGADQARDIRDRRDRTHAQREVEAEMTAYLVAKRNGLTPKSESYLDGYQGAFTDLDLYGVMRAANAVETAMGISAHQLKQQEAAGAAG